MTRIPWQPDPPPFGNAAGLDSVSSDVHRRICEAHGISVTIGRLPADLDAHQEADREAHEARYGPRDDERDPFHSFTISQDGGSYSGSSTDGTTTTQGYRHSYWSDRIGPSTVVYDWRTADFADAYRCAVRGPMEDPRLPAGTVDTLGPVPAIMEPVAEAYMRHAGATLDATGAERESQ